MGVMKNAAMLTSHVTTGSTMKRYISDLVVSSKLNQITTITLNDPRKYNALSISLCFKLKEEFESAYRDRDTKVIILTAVDPYFCSGGSLGELLGRVTPSKLQKWIRKNNEMMFNIILDANKPVIAAVNGPGIGGGTTLPALCDMTVASERATFYTPFSKLGVSPEGCSSVHFERILGPEGAKRMLEECSKLNAGEALALGLVNEVVDHQRLQERAQEIAELWAREERTRTIRGGATTSEYKAINAKESEQLSQDFVSHKFLINQYEFLRAKGKHRSAAGVALLLMIKTRPVWAKTLV